MQIYKKNYIYKNGVFKVGVDNPGAYTYAAQLTSQGLTLDTNKFVIGPSASSAYVCILGTSSLFDFTNYTTLNVRCKKLASGNAQIAITPTKTNIMYNTTIREGIASTSEHVVTIDVSALTTAYLCFYGGVNDIADVYEIWCE